jgi:hypothetical protein
MNNIRVFRTKWTNLEGLESYRIWLKYMPDHDVWYQRHEWDTRMDEWIPSIRQNLDEVIAKYEEVTEVGVNKLECSYTERGFALYEFKDTSGATCSIQKSSVIDEERIWLGADELGLKAFYGMKPGQTQGEWVDVDVSNLLPGADGIVDNCRMHLNQEQVAQLLPILQRFVETGEIYE